MSKLAYTGTTVTLLDNGDVLIWYAYGPVVKPHPPIDLLEAGEEGTGHYYHWLDYWREEDNFYGEA